MSDNLPEPDDGLTEEERRRRQQRRRDFDSDGPDVLDAAEVATSSGCSSPFRRGSSGGRSRSGICDVCDLLVLVRLSTVLFILAKVVPAGSAPLVRAAIRGYRRWLTRYTPACPSSPSCSAYALTAVESLGPRRGLVVAARRIHGCGRDASRTRSDRRGGVLR